MSTGFNVTNAAPTASAASAAPETESINVNTGSGNTGSQQPFGADASGPSTFDSIFHGGGLMVVSPAVEKYINEVDPLVKSVYPNIQTGFVDGLPTARYYIATRADGNKVATVMMFVTPQTKDERDIGWRKRDTKTAFGWLYTQFPGIMIADLVTLLTTYSVDMERVKAGAEDIIRVLRYKTDTRAMSTAAIFQGHTLTTNYDLDEVRANIAAVSPHGVIPRMETGAVYQTQISNQRDMSRGNHWNPAQYMDDSPQRPTNVVSIGGYAEIGLPVRRQTENGIEERFEVFYHITGLYSPFAVLGMAAMALASFSAHIINDMGWVAQFYNKKANGDLGNLVEDGEVKDHLFSTRSNDEVRAFAAQQCWKPVIVLDSMAGFDIFPGLNNLTTENVDRRKRVAAYMCKFFGRSETNMFTANIARFLGLTLEGYYGSPEGTLRDTRTFDWFKLVQRDGIDALSSQQGRIWRMLCRDDLWVMDRFKSLRDRLPDVIPMAERNMHVINPAWLNWIASAMKDAKIKIQDTSVSDSYARNVGSVDSSFIVDRIEDPTTTLFGSQDITDADIFNV